PLRAIRTRRHTACFSSGRCRDDRRRSMYREVVAAALPVQSPLAIRGGEEGWQSGRRPMTRIASKFGIAAALTLVAVSAAAAQVVRPTTTSTVSKGEVTPPKVDTVTVTRVDTVYQTQYRRDTITV